MKEILAVIRPDKAADTKKALSDNGFPGFTGRGVNGRGREAVSYEMPDHSVHQFYLLPKRAFILEVEDDDIQEVVELIMDVNSTGNQGDGKIFVLPVHSSYVVSSGEKE